MGEGRGEGSPTPHSALRTPHFEAPHSTAFTLVELLMVIAIIGVLAAVALPSIGPMKPNPAVVGAQQLLADIDHARQLAISQRTTVYMVFVPPGLFADAAALQSANLPEPDLALAKNLLDKQMVGYNLLCLRSAGEQPGQRAARYLDTWRTLPEGAFIAARKFGPVTRHSDVYTIDDKGDPTVFASFNGFHTDNIFPFPSEQTPPTDGHWANLPYIAFNPKGQLVQRVDGEEKISAIENIPLARGSVWLPRDPVTHAAEPGPVSGLESPSGNSTMLAFNLIHIDGLTGKAIIQRQEAK
jgi:prepilin-type N-terminal cleavage/methylation domain-containing protein